MPSRQVLAALTFSLVLAVLSRHVVADDEALRREILEVKDRVRQLEARYAQQRTEQDAVERARTWLDRIDISASATGILQGTAGVRKRLRSDGDAVDASLAAELRLAAKLDEFDKVVARVEAGSGQGLDGNVPTISGLNDSADDDAALRLTELWYQRRFLADRLALVVGKIDLTGACGHHENAFDANAAANDACLQFLSSAFVNNIAVDWPDDNGPALALWAYPHDLLHAGIAVADADGDWNDVADHTFLMLQLEFRPKLADLQGNYRVYGWINNKDHPTVRDENDTGHAGYGLGASCDQALTDHLTAFVRYGWQRQDVYRFDHAWSAGFLVSGKLFGRQDDSLGLAYGMAVPSEDYRTVRRADSGKPGNEHHLEVFYALRVNSCLTISPDIQWVLNPECDRSNDAAWAFGLRANLAF